MIKLRMRGLTNCNRTYDSCQKPPVRKVVPKALIITLRTLAGFDPQFFCSSSHSLSQLGKMVCMLKSSKFG